MDSEVDLIIDSISPYQNFGRSISNLGDFNNDGYDDIVVGAYYSNASGFGESSVFIFFGGEKVDDVADITITKSWMDFGKCVSLAGDINEDGYSDLMVSDRSNVFIYYGCKDGDQLKEEEIHIAEHRQWSGFSLSYAGDVNGDGLTDILIGEPYNSATGTYNGRVFIYSDSNYAQILNEDDRNYINSFELFQNYPNPFNSETTITYKINEAQNVSLRIHDINGRVVSKMDRSHPASGTYKFRLNTQGLASGVYLYQVKVGPSRKCKKFIILK